MLKHSFPPDCGLPASIAPCPRARKSSRSTAARSRSRTRTRSTSPTPATRRWTSSRTTSRSPTARCAARGGRPMALKRFVDGDHRSEAFFQKRAPDNRPDWLRVADADVPVRPDGRRDRPRRARPASPGSPTSAASTSTRTRSAPRTSTTPTSCASTSTRCPGVAVGRRSATSRSSAQEALEAVGLVGWPKTSGSRGIHINVRIERRWTYAEVRRAALALARDVEARAPSIATSKWWKEERHGVFLDYNQNAKDRTVASAYSVRPLPDARVSMPLRWDEVPDVRAGGLHDRDGAARSSPSAATPGDGIDDAVGSLEALLELSAAARGRGPGRRAVAAELREAGGRAAAGPAVAGPPAEDRVRGGPRHRGRPAAGGRGGASRRGRGGRPRTPACRPSGRGHAARRRRPAAARRRSRSSRSAGRPRRQEALEGLERWKERHPEAAPHLEPADVLVDGMRGRSSLWYRVRVNLIHVPEADRPAAGGARPGLRPVGRLRVAGPGRPAGAGAAQEARELRPTRRRSSRSRRRASPRAGRSVQSAGDLSGRQRLNVVPCRNRSPWRWSNATSTTRSARSGSHDRSLPRFQRDVAPGSRWPDASAAPATDHSAHSCHGWPSIAFSRSGSSSVRIDARRSHVNDDVIPTWLSLPSSPYSPSSSDPTCVPGPFLCQRKPATTQSAVRWCLIFSIARLPGRYFSESFFATTPSRPAPSKRWNQSSARARSRRGRREMDRVVARAAANACSSSCATLALGRRAQVAVVEREQVPRHERRGRLLGEHPDPRLRRVDPEQQRLELELAVAPR